MYLNLFEVKLKCLQFNIKNDSKYDLSIFKSFDKMTNNALCHLAIELKMDDFIHALIKTDINVLFYAIKRYVILNNTSKCLKLFEKYDNILKMDNAKNIIQYFLMASIISLNFKIFNYLIKNFNVDLYDNEHLLKLLCSNKIQNKKCYRNFAYINIKKIIFDNYVFNDDIKKLSSTFLIELSYLNNDNDSVKKYFEFLSELKYNLELENLEIMLRKT